MAQKAAQSEELQNIIVELARTELAAVGAALKFWSNWIGSAEKYSQGLSAVLQKVSDGGGVSPKFVGNLADLTREYLREMADLPKVAAEHFGVEMNKISKPAAKRTRRARAKE